ncbi:GyrI-like domain-containing protein [Evansella clarkii]|uniref:GyrI-like domain-containing protein n=1 Tax=Evansella clarkii TaxID=79879 RepID=UPI000995EB55|nr:GyrI-like domain-containing protein [Evansella clarkii]
MSARVVTKKAFSIAGYEFKANLQEIEEQELGKQTLARLKENGELVKSKVGEQIYLVQVYDMKPNFDPMVDPFTQVIGYEISEAEDLPEDMILHTVPENKYVTVTHEGLEKDLARTYDYLYGTWMKLNNCQPAGYDFEIWDNRYKPGKPENEIDLYVAITD